MSQKYPEGAIIFVPTYPTIKFKVIGACGNCRFFIKDNSNLGREVIVRSVFSMMEDNYVVEETPWVPEEGDDVWALHDETLEPMRSRYNGNVRSYRDFKEQGRLYPTEELAQAAALRVKAAYKGEK